MRSIAGEVSDCARVRTGMGKGQFRPVKTVELCVSPADRVDAANVSTRFQPNRLLGSPARVEDSIHR